MDRFDHDDIADAENETVQGATATFQIAMTGYLLHRQQNAQQQPERDSDRENQPGPETEASPERPAEQGRFARLRERIGEAWRVLTGRAEATARPEPETTPATAPETAAPTGPGGDQIAAAAHAADRALWSQGVDARAIPGMSDVELRSAWDAAQKWTTIDPDANAAARHVAQTVLENGRDIGIDTETLTPHADGQVQVNAEAATELSALTGRTPQLDADPQLRAASEQLNSTWQETATAPARFRQILADYAPDQIGAIERSKSWKSGELVNGLRDMEKGGTDVKAWLNDKAPDLAGARTPGAYLNKIVKSENAPQQGGPAPAAANGNAGPQPANAKQPIGQKVSAAKQNAAQQPRQVAIPKAAKQPTPTPVAQR